MISAKSLLPCKVTSSQVAGTGPSASLGVGIIQPTAPTNDVGIHPFISFLHTMTWWSISWNLAGGGKSPYPPGGPASTPRPSSCMWSSSHDLVVWPLPDLGRGQTHVGHSRLISLWLQNAINQSASEPATLREHSICYVPGTSLALCWPTAWASVSFMGMEGSERPCGLLEVTKSGSGRLDLRSRVLQIPTLTPQ